MVGYEDQRKTHTAISIGKSKTAEATVLYSSDPTARRIAQRVLIDMDYANQQVSKLSRTLKSSEIHISDDMSDEIHAVHRECKADIESRWILPQMTQEELHEKFLEDLNQQGSAEAGYLAGLEEHSGCRNEKQIIDGVKLEDL